MGKLRTLPPWHKEPCHHCGVEYQVTRADFVTVTAAERLLCDGCEMYDRGYRDGREAASAVSLPEKKLAAMTAERDRWLKRMQDLEGRITAAESALKGKK